IEVAADRSDGAVPAEALRAALQHIAIALHGTDHTAWPRRRLHNQCGDVGLLQRIRGGEPGDSRANHKSLDLRGHSVCPSAKRRRFYASRIAADSTELRGIHRRNAYCHPERSEGSAFA